MPEWDPNGHEDWLNSEQCQQELDEEEARRQEAQAEEARMAQQGPDRHDELAAKIWDNEGFHTELSIFFAAFRREDTKIAVTYAKRAIDTLAALLREREGDFANAVKQMANQIVANSVAPPALPQNWQEAVQSGVDEFMDHEDTVDDLASQTPDEFRRIVKRCLPDHITSALSPLVEAVRGEVKAISNLCEDASAEWFEVRKHSRAALALLGEVKEETSGNQD